jgi:site-specific DNA-cytosine methylase
MVLATFHLFVGCGGGLLSDLLLGHHPVGAVEIDPYCREVLLQRQRDGCLPAFPIWDDVRTFRLDNPDTRPFIRSLQERAEGLIIAGGFPCTDISVAGKGLGISGPQSGLWTEFARILGEIRPRYAFIENTAALTARGLTRVLSDLAALGMDARWCCLGADDVGAPHIRKRLWILAESQCAGRGRVYEWQQPGYLATNVGERRPDEPGGSTSTNHGRRVSREGTKSRDASYPISHPLREQSGGHRRTDRTRTSQPGDDGAAPDVADPTRHEPGRQEQRPEWERAGECRESGTDEPGRASAGGAGGSVHRACCEHTPEVGHTQGRHEHGTRPATRPARRDESADATGWELESDVGLLAPRLASGLDGPWSAEPPGVPRVARDVPQRTHQLKALGNGQVPLCAAVAWRLLLAGHEETTL